MQTSDILIIGAGPGGYETAALAASRGLTVTLVERNLLGGTCLNSGCIPTKTLSHAAGLLTELHHAAGYGLSADGVTFDYAALTRRKDDVITTLRDGIRMLLAKVNIVSGEARFTAPKTVVVGDETYTADRVIIATGSLPASLPVEGAEHTVNSDYLLSMTSLPASMTIIGGGVIGMEFASIYNALGVDVTVVEYCREVLPAFDKDIAKRLRTALTAEGIKFLTGAQVTSITADGTTHYICKGKECTHPADMTVMAVGRRPNLPDGLNAAGVDYTPKGIMVDHDTYETTSPGTYAIGDVNGICMLAHAASAQGRRVIGERIDTGVIPSAVFTVPEVAAVGLTEEACKERGLEYKAVKALLRSNGKAVSMGAEGGMVKLIVDPDGHLLGCHIMAPHAADIIHEAALAMSARLTVRDIAATVHTHPTLSETLLQAVTSAL